jgi:hypothetical protein
MVNIQLRGDSGDWPILNMEQAQYRRLYLFGNCHIFLPVFDMYAGASAAISICAQQKHTCVRSCCNTAASVVFLIELQVDGLLLAPPAQLLQENYQKKRSDASLSHSLSSDKPLDEQHASALQQNFFGTELLPTAAIFAVLVGRMCQNNNDCHSHIPGTATPGHYTNHTPKFARPVLRFPLCIRQSDWTNTPRIYDTLLNIVFHDARRFELPSRISFSLPHINLTN